MCLAIPGEVRSIEGARAAERSGMIRFGTLEKRASLAFVPEARVGDYVLVHAGVAISIVQPEEARRLFDYLDSIGAAAS
ncbi:MAG: HypC/HybG/HupF family hydrogenase formation chaperone [Pseudomonadales bacterium]|nr:HypC/HybG/HupF family hydrogenase formation chaperone [Pseudomonadales bacterium]